MKRMMMTTAAVALCLTVAACSAGPATDRYVGSGESAPTPGEATAASGMNEAAAPVEAAAEPSAGQPDSASATENAAANGASAEVTKPGTGYFAESPPTPSPSPSPSAKTNEAAQSAASPRPAKEAQKNNESTNKAAVGSIMAGGDDKHDADQAADPKLGQSVERIRDLVKSLKPATENGDAEQIAKLASQIAADWAAIKTVVDASFSDNAEFIQSKIDALSELTGQEKLDPDALLKLDYELYQAIRQLADTVGS